MQLARHRADAVAWHDGPDWAGRDQDPARRATQKAAETATLATLLPDPPMPPRIARARDLVRSA